MDIDKIIAAIYAIHEELHKHNESIAQKFADSIELGDREASDVDVVQNFVNLIEKL